VGEFGGDAMENVGEWGGDAAGYVGDMAENFDMEGVKVWLCVSVCVCV